MQPVLLALLLSFPGADAAGPAAIPPGPLEFRCNNMQVLSKPNRTLCRDDVVVRRGDLLLCCQQFEGFADKDWAWQRFTCTREVRAERNNEQMWADKAELTLATSDLVLTGRPKLRRGKSLLEGTRVVVDIKEDHARIESPRGVLVSEEAAPASAGKSAGPLPERCPIPPPPRAP